MVRNLGYIFAIAVVALLTFAGSASASPIIIYGGSSDYTPIAGASLTDVRMQVDMTVASGKAVFTFTNVSVGKETTAALSEIVIDGTDDDTGSVLLYNPKLLSGNFKNPTESNGLPGYHDITSDTPPMFELNAKPPSSKNGLLIGQSLSLQFQTTLADGSTMQDYLNAFGGGLDTALGSIGFHAINSSIIDGQSLSGAAVPEPVTMALLSVSAIALLRRRKATVK